jgi:hypothetical protein
LPTETVPVFSQKEAAISAFRNTDRTECSNSMQEISATARERSHLLLQLIILFDYKLILILKKNPVDLN